MIDKIPNTENVVVPFRGYSPGWNLIVYNNNKSSITDVIAGFMNSGEFQEFDAMTIALAISNHGYISIPFKNDKDKADKVYTFLRQVGVQVEVIYEKGKTEKIRNSRKRGDFIEQ